MIMRHCFTAAVFALAAAGALMPRLAWADPVSRAPTLTSVTNKPTVGGSDQKKTVEGAGSGSSIGGTNTVSTNPLQSGSFNPNQVCFSNCTAPRQTSAPQPSASPLTMSKSSPLRR